MYTACTQFGSTENGIKYDESNIDILYTVCFTINLKSNCLRTAETIGLIKVKNFTFIIFEMKKTSNSKQPIELIEDAEGILKAFGKKLKIIRTTKDFYQESAAYVSGLSRSYYAEVELGKRNVSLINIIKIAVAMEVELDELLSFKEYTKIFK